MLTRMLFGLIASATVLFSTPCLAMGGSSPQESSPPGSYLYYHTVNSMNYTGCTLDDGSTWSFTSPISQFLLPGTQIWIVPIMQQQPMEAIFLSVWFVPTSAQFVSGSTTVNISSITSSGIVTLSDYSQWALDPYYKNYTSGWKVGDPITKAGRHNEYYLINGNVIPPSQGATYCLVTKLSDCP